MGAGALRLIWKEEWEADRPRDDCSGFRPMLDSVLPKADPRTSDGAMISQLISLLGAGLLLGAYLALQRGWMGPKDRWYNLMNFLGAAILTGIALLDQRWGFILLEGTWALLSVPPLLKRS